MTRMTLALSLKSILAISLVSQLLAGEIAESLYSIQLQLRSYFLFCLFFVTMSCLVSYQKQVLPLP